MGVEYHYEEEMRRDVIKAFPGQQIMIFPQTMDFGQTAFGRAELAVSSAVYRAHRRLTICARDESSYQAMQAAFPLNQLFFCPDIVLSLPLMPAGADRCGALLCLRGDREGVLGPAEKEGIAGICRQKFSRVESTDTCLFHEISSKAREAALKEKWAQFSRAELVVTDRLHGMIFAALTGTPCIALGNYNFKVRDAYQWLQPLGYIKFADQPGEIPGMIAEMARTVPPEYDQARFDRYFDQLAEGIRAGMAGNATDPAENKTKK